MISVMGNITFQYITFSAWIVGRKGGKLIRRTGKTNLYYWDIDSVELFLQYKYFDFQSLIIHFIDMNDSIQETSPSRT